MDVSSSSDAGGISKRRPRKPHLVKKNQEKKSKRREARKGSAEEAARQASRRLNKLQQSKPASLGHYSANDAAHTDPSYIGARENDEDYGGEEHAMEWASEDASEDASECTHEYPAEPRIQYLKTIGYRVTICDEQ